jgi:hypothetical protein
MNAYGMIGPYRVNRELTSDERSAQLKQKKKQSDDPHYELSLIRINSTFVESVDQFYWHRGFIAMCGAVFGLLPLAMGINLLISYIGQGKSPPSAAVLFMVLSTAGFWLFLTDAFTHTHYPIRFNRKNREVYFWQREGFSISASGFFSLPIFLWSRKAKVVKAAWDEIFFTIVCVNEVHGDSVVMGHVLAADKKTVITSFSLAHNGFKTQSEIFKSHFEYFRRYMEDGPVIHVKGEPLVCLPPLDQQRESWFFGWNRVNAMANGLPVVQFILQPIFFPWSLFRWIVMHTSKIPKWPEWVQQECAIEPTDTFVHDWTNNPKGLGRWGL